MLAQAEQIIKQAIFAYQALEERRRREAEALAAAALRREREKLAAEALRAEAKGKFEKAEALRMTAAASPVRIDLAATAAPLAGLVARSTWRAELTDKRALVGYVAEHPEWLTLLEPNMTALNSLVRSQKTAFAMPGVKAVEEKQLVATAG